MVTEGNAAYGIARDIDSTAQQLITASFPPANATTGETVYEAISILEMLRMTFPN